MQHCSLIIAVVCGWFASQGEQQKVQLEPIFNGTNLDGWKIPANKDCWAAADGVLHVKSDSKQTGSILWTEADYTDFIIELEFKFGAGTVDSGVFVRKESEQIQIGISGSLKRDMTASPYISGKGYPVEAENVQKLLKPDDWNTMKIQAVGETYTTWLDGEKVMTYKSDSAAKTGPIGLQLHPGREMEIAYRSIKLAELR